MDRGSEALEPDIEAAVALAVTLFQEHPGADDNQIEGELVARGVEPGLATRLIQFLPIAFCRVLLRPQGVRFPDHYVVMGPGGTLVGEYPLEQEPVYVQATVAARREVEAGRGGEPFLSIAGRSAAFHSVMDLVRNGSRLDKILCSPPILQAPATSGSQAAARDGWRWPWQRRRQ